MPLEAATSRFESWLGSLAVAGHRRAQEEAMAAIRAGTATTLAVVATDVPLSKAGCQALAGVAHDGFARALSPVHTAFDGDAVFALSTGTGPEPSRIDLVDLQTAAADVVARAIARERLQLDLTQAA